MTWILIASLEDVTYSKYVLQEDEYGFPTNSITTCKNSSDHFRPKVKILDMFCWLIILITYRHGCMVFKCIKEQIKGLDEPDIAQRRKYHEAMLILCFMTTAVCMMIISVIHSVTFRLLAKYDYVGSPISHVNIFQAVAWQIIVFVKLRLCVVPWLSQSDVLNDNMAFIEVIDDGTGSIISALTDIQPILTASDLFAWVNASANTAEQSANSNNCESERFSSGD